MPIVTSYYRLAKSYQLLNDNTKAIEVLRGDLIRPSIKNDKGLGDYLQELETANEAVSVHEA